MLVGTGRPQRAKAAHQRALTTITQLSSTVVSPHECTLQFVNWWLQAHPLISNSPAPGAWSTIDSMELLLVSSYLVSTIQHLVSFCCILTIQYHSAHFFSLFFHTVHPAISAWLRKCAPSPLTLSTSKICYQLANALTILALSFASLNTPTFSVLKCLNAFVDWVSTCKRLFVFSRFVGNRLFVRVLWREWKLYHKLTIVSLLNLASLSVQFSSYSIAVCLEKERKCLLVIFFMLFILVDDLCDFI